MSLLSCRIFLCAVLSFCSLNLVTASHEISPFLHRRHTSNATLVKREAASFRRSTSLEKRFDNARFTFYAVGLGACGQTNVASDFVVALNSAQYNGGQYCFQTITISYNGKSTQAQIVDECPGCPDEGLDFSQSLFEFFAPTSTGVIYGTWNFDNSGSSSSSSTPSSTYNPPSSTSSSSTSSSSTTPSSTSAFSSSSSSSASSSSSSSVSSSSSYSAVSTSSTTSGSAATSATPSPTALSGTLGVVEQAVIQMAMIAAAV